MPRSWFLTISSERTRGSLGKWLIPGLSQEMDGMRLGDLVVPQRKEALIRNPQDVGVSDGHKPLKGFPVATAGTVLATK